ncbi:regulator [Pueribacillus theae]|uniref:Regulator n=1 Tax=Pueribacillus theae TaxID=2171751 RepID=A0A2U1K778_9BACI|nr:YlbF family regulator [Pueribacillus theae]PWA13387.1 regulator [Pueribacillus theae]
MIATSDLLEVIENSNMLATYISQSEIANKYRQAKESLAHNLEAQQLIARFSKMKEEYDEVQRFGKYHPNFTEISTKMRHLKRELDLNEAVAAFKQSEADLESLLNEVSAIIAGAVSPFIKVPTGNPFFDNRSCEGGCGSGGACNCG